jgi:ADP-L-glycero-D-manno-heptose 6-epimerase
VAPEDLADWLELHGEGLEAVVHMGAISATTETDVDLIVENNVRATLGLLDWCTQRSVRLVYASSAATYGDGSGGFDDDFSRAALAKLRPLNAYGWSKHVVDRRIARLREAGCALPPQWVGLKFFNVYGPNEYHKGAMQSVIARNYPVVRAGQAIRLFRSNRAEYADGGQLRDFVYVRDCVDVVLWLLDQPQVSGVFNHGAVEFTDMPAELIEKYQYFTEARMERLIAAGYAKPFTSLEEGVLDYVRHHLDTDDPYR